MMAFSGYADDQIGYQEIEFINVTGQSTNGNSGDVMTFTVPLMPHHSGMLFFLEVIAASGTPTLDVSVNAKVNGAYFGLGSFAQQTGTGKALLTIARAPQTLQVAFTIGGITPSFDFKVTGVRC